MRPAPPSMPIRSATAARRLDRALEAETQDGIPKLDSAGTGRAAPPTKSHARGRRGALGAPVPGLLHRLHHGGRGRDPRLAQRRAGHGPVLARREHGGGGLHPQVDALLVPAPAISSSARCPSAGRIAVVHAAPRPLDHCPRAWYRGPGSAPGQ